MSPARSAAAAAAPAAATTAAATEDTRARLLRAGLRLFAQQGFAKTSTRELAEAAEVNIAAISYYFGDKAGLYRAVFFEPLGYRNGGSPTDDIQRFTDPALPLPQALAAFYDAFLEPLKEGEASRQCMKLHFREMLEPTGLWDEELAHGIKPMHDALLSVLRRELRLPRADDDLQRLAVAIAGLGVHMHVGRDVTDQVAPGLTDTPAHFDIWRERLVMFAAAMIEAERARRAAAKGARR